MAIDRNPPGQIVWKIAKTEFRSSLKVGSALFAAFTLIYLATGFSGKQALLMAALFLLASLGVVGIDLPQEFKRRTGYPSFREVDWRIYAFAMSCTSGVWASALWILQILKGSKEYHVVAVAFFFGAGLGALLAAIPAKRS